jgi:hypothetical protein
VQALGCRLFIDNADDGDPRMYTHDPNQTGTSSLVRRPTRSGTGSASISSTRRREFTWQVVQTRGLRRMSCGPPATRIASCRDVCGKRKRSRTSCSSAMTATSQNATQSSRQLRCCNRMHGRAPRHCSFTLGSNRPQGWHASREPVEEWKPERSSAPRPGAAGPSTTVTGLPGDSVCVRHRVWRAVNSGHGPEAFRSSRPGGADSFLRPPAHARKR